MNTSDFDFHLPTGQIAQHSVEPRDHSKLMLIDRSAQMREHKQFFDIVEYFRPGDMLVWNVSKVFKARLNGKLLTKNEEGLWNHKRDVEIFLVRPMENLGVWKTLGKPGRHIQNGTRVQFSPEDADEVFYAEPMLKEQDGTLLMQFFENDDKPLADDEVRRLANLYGDIPIPPYVKEVPGELEQYQTVYADDTQEGSVAAPTAGFHFTGELIQKIREKGVEFAEVTLHVGLGTFLPVKVDDVSNHKMHSEWVELNEENTYKINQAKARGSRVITVGTTSTRALEGIAAAQGTASLKNGLEPFTGDIDIFITPGFEFKIIDGLITNFHLPKSTLLMLVSAFVGSREYTLECYEEAVKKKYRFFSFGDSMFIY